MVTEKQIKSLMTREQRHHARRYDKMFVSRQQVTSEPFGKLTGAAPRVFMLFLTKRQMKKVETRKGKSENDYYIANNGEIQFTYNEAIGKYGITRPRFAKAIDQLVELGFIDITRSGSGQHKNKSLYAISDRWQEFGTTEFIKKKRPVDKQSYGFQRKDAKRKSQRR